MDQKPYCLAMVLCDAVHRDSSTGKFTILGTFSRLNGSAFPVRARFCVYFSITDARGSVPLGVRIVDSAAQMADDKDGGVIFTSDLPSLQLDNPLMIVDGVCGIRVDFPKPGVYHCELFSGNEDLMARRLIVNGLSPDKVEKP